jgi:hypothetical protein
MNYTPAINRKRSDEESPEDLCNHGDELLVVTEKTRIAAK